MSRTAKAAENELRPSSHLATEWPEYHSSNVANIGALLAIFTGVFENLIHFGNLLFGHLVESS